MLRQPMVLTMMVALVFKNRGLDTNSNKWSDIEGKARAASDEYSSMIEVSFFGPFYAGYNVIALDTVRLFLRYGLWVG